MADAAETAPKKEPAKKKPAAKKEAAAPAAEASKPAEVKKAGKEPAEAKKGDKEPAAEETEKKGGKKPAAKKEPKTEAKPEETPASTDAPNEDAASEGTAKKKPVPKKEAAKPDAKPEKAAKAEKAPDAPDAPAPEVPAVEAKTKPAPAAPAKKNAPPKEEKKVAPSENPKNQENDNVVDKLSELWQEFQTTMKFYKERSEKIENVVSKVESKVEKLGKFCGEYQLIWRLKSFDANFQAAKSGERSVVYSPQFDTHRNGYKLQLSVCLNGDGKARGMAMSIFFTILKGQYDNLLSWPFTCPVTITLLEQVADMSIQRPRDITMTFSPNPNPGNAPFLNRPSTDRNMSLGFQKFIPLAELFDGEYIRDDSLFIKVAVDLSTAVTI